MRLVKAILFTVTLITAGICNAATITTSGSGAWSSTTPGAPWPGGTIPLPTDDIVIGAGFTLTVDGARTCNSLQVGNGSTITVNTLITLTVTNGISFPNQGNTSTTGIIAGLGTINAATLSIGNTNLPTGNATVTVTSTITALNLSGTLTLTSQRPLTVANNPIFQLQSGTVTVNGALSCVTTNNAASTTLVTLATGAQSGTLILGNATPITTSGNAGVSTFTFTGTTATVNYSGAAQTVFNVNYTNLTLSGSGTKTLQTGTTTIGGNLTLSGTASATTVVGLSITNNLNIGDGTTFSVAAFNITVSGTANVGGGTSGQLVFSGAAGTKSFNSIAIGASGTWNNAANVNVSIKGNFSAGSNATFTQGTGRVTFTGATSNTVTSVNTTLAFSGGITVNKGTSQANVIDIQAVITLLQGGLILTNGTFKLSSNSSITPFLTDPNFGSTAQLWCNGGTILGGTTFTYSGAIQVSAGTLNIGTTTDDYLFPDGGSLTISGGALNVAGELSDDAGGSGGGVTFNMSGGICTLNTVGSTLDYPLFLDAGSQFTMTGGTIVIQNPGAIPPSSGNFPNPGYFNHATTSFTGGTLQIGNSFTSSSSSIGIDATSPIFNLSINSSNAIALIQTQALTVSNNVTISSGNLNVSGFDMSVGGNWTNNDTFTPGANTVTFNGAAQTVSGSSTTFNNLVLTGGNTKTFSVAMNVGGNLSIASGTVANLSTITTHKARTLTLGGLNQTATGSYGGPTSAAVNINPTYFATATGQLNATNVIYFSRQTGNWNVNNTWSTVTYGGPAAGAFPVAGDDVNIGGGNFTITVNVNSACGSLSFQAGSGNTRTVTINTGTTLAVSGAITIPWATGGSALNTVAVGAGTLTAGSVAFTNTTNLPGHQITISTGIATITGDVTSDGGNGSPTFTFTGAGTLNLGGAFLNANTCNLNIATGCTVNYNGAAQVVGNFTYSNLTFSGSGVKDLSTLPLISNINNNFVMAGTASTTPQGSLTIGGSVTLGSGTTFNAGSLNHNVAGNWTNNGGTFINTGSTITLNGAAQSINGSSPSTFNNLSLTGSNTKTFSVVVTIGSNLSIASGVVANLSTITTHTARTLTLNGLVQTLTGTWGGTGSGATNVNPTFFAATMGLLNVTNTIYFSRANTNWNLNTTWSNVTYGGTPSAVGSFPVAGDDVNIGNGNTVTVNVNSACGTLNYQSNNTTNIVIINPGVTLAVSGAITLSRPSNGGAKTNLLAVGAGTLTAGSLAFTNNGGGVNLKHILSISTGTATINGDVTTDGLATSPTFTFTGAGILQLGGAFLNSTNGTLTPSTGTVRYIGSVAQSIGDFTYTNLTLNNTSTTIPQLTLVNNVTNNGISTFITGNLTMTSGVVNLNAAVLTLGNGAIASLTRTASTTTNWFYNGTLRRYWGAGIAITSTSGSMYGLFPMGSSTASSYHPLEVNSTANPTTAGTYSVTHTSSTATTDLSPVYNDAGINIVRINNASFVGSINNVAGGTYNISATMSGLNSVGNLTDIRLAIHTGGTTASAVGTYQLATGTAANPTATRTGISLNNLSNDFRIATTNGVATPLPIELLNFTGEANSYSVALNWTTASELNNNYFTLLRSSSGDLFESISEVPGSKTATAEHTYTFIDYNPVIGKNYYQLQQTDLDGHTVTLKVIRVDVANPEDRVSFYPNPVSRIQPLNFQISGLPVNTAVPVQIVNIQGITIKATDITTDSSGTLKGSLDPASFPIGLYIFRVPGIVRKFIVE